MSEMIERVAASIHRDRISWRKPQDRKPWEEASTADRRLAQSHARAALEALRDPTDEMLEAGKVPMIDLGDGFSVPGLGASADSVWHRMIDRALQEKEG